MLADLAMPGREDKEEAGVGRGQTGQGRLLG